MKLTDIQIIEALNTGQKIKRVRYEDEFAVMSQYDALYWVNEDGYPIRPVSIADMFEDDWEVVK